MNTEWYEVWADDTSSPPYLLIVTLGEEGKIIVRDPRNANKVVHTADNYNDAMYWLTEDEYTLVGHRMETG